MAAASSKGSWKELGLPLDDEDEASVKCEKCGKSFTRACNLKIHKLIHSGEKPHSCDVCGKSFRHKSNHARHMTNLHGDQLPHECSVCKKRFLTEIMLRHHVKRTPYGGARGGADHTPTTPTTITATSGNPELPFACCLCEDRAFKRKCSLMRHVKAVHFNNPEFVCPICEAAFRDRASLGTHVAAMHRYANVFPCEACGKVFRSRNSLVYHEKRAHVETCNMFKCSECKMSFTTRPNLNKHKRLHLGRRPYSCFCGKTFSQKTHLNRHSRIHTKERPYKCLGCGKRYIDRHQLGSHVKRCKLAGGGLQSCKDGGNVGAAATSETKRRKRSRETYKEEDSEEEEGESEEHDSEEEEEENEEHDSEEEEEDEEIKVVDDESEGGGEDLDYEESAGLKRVVARGVATVTGSKWMAGGSSRFEVGGKHGLQFDNGRKKKGDYGINKPIKQEDKMTVTTGNNKGMNRKRGEDKMAVTTGSNNGMKQEEEEEYKMAAATGNNEQKLGEDKMAITTGSNKRIKREQEDDEYQMAVATGDTSLTEADFRVLMLDLDEEEDSE